MSTRDLALATFEQLLNTLLKLDPAAGRRLRLFHGRTIAIHLRGLELTLYLVPEQTGEVQVLGSCEAEPDCTLSGSPADLIRSGDRKDGPAQLFAGRVSITGDTELAHRFGEVLSNLDIDWEEQLSHITGDVIAHQTGRAVRGISGYLGQSTDTTAVNLGEYLTEELHLLPHRTEVELFLEDVDVLRDDVERLQARLQRLRQRRESAGRHE